MDLNSNWIERNPAVCIPYTSGLSGTTTFALVPLDRQRDAGTPSRRCLVPKPGTGTMRAVNCWLRRGFLGAALPFGAGPDRSPVLSPARRFLPRGAAPRITPGIRVTSSRDGEVGDGGLALAARNRRRPPQSLALWFPKPARTRTRATPLSMRISSTISFEREHRGVRLLPASRNQHRPCRRARRRRRAATPSRGGSSEVLLPQFARGRCAVRGVEIQPPPAASA